MSEEEVPVASFDFETEALMWAERLTRSGIPCVVVPIGRGVGGWGQAIWRPFELRVRTRDVERAKQLLPAEG